MTIKDVQDQIEAIKQIVDDGERAHGAEDDLYAAVLLAIADGTAEDPREMARLALTTLDLSFSRWCA